MRTSSLLLVFALLLSPAACRQAERTTTVSPAISTAEPGTAASSSQTVVHHVDAEQAAKILADNPETAVLDVRTPEEFAAGHISGATNIDFNAEDFEQKLAELDKTKPYLLHCASGRRSTRSLEVFQKNGFGQIYHLDGGFNSWKAAGKPVEP